MLLFFLIFKRVALYLRVFSTIISKSNLPLFLSLLRQSGKITVK
uniref:Uncharacterized protein n=1 Tax=Heterorhabditis bacteriophora TaxID=37862 RepID=A0A1I7XE76_HETBA